MRHLIETLWSVCHSLEELMVTIGGFTNGKKKTKTNEKRFEKVKTNRRSSLYFFSPRICLDFQSSDMVNE